DAYDQRLEHHRPQDLPAGSSDRAHGRELAGALSDRDRERVGDHEGAHEECDAAEREQKALQEAEKGLWVAGSLRGLALARPDLRRGWQDLPDLTEQLSLAHPGLGGGADLVELALLVEELLRRREVEGGERRSADVPLAAEIEEAGNAHRHRRALALHADLLPDLDVLLRRRGRVDRDLAVRGPFALLQDNRVEARLRRVDREADVRGAAELDHLAVPADQLRLSSDAADRSGDVRQGLHLREQRLVEGRILDARLAGEVE